MADLTGATGPQDPPQWQQGDLFAADPPRRPEPPPARVKQNPPVAKGKPQQGEQCPAHGYYIPDPEAFRQRRLATSGRVDTRRARTLLDTAGRMIRTCHTCRTTRPSWQQWAEQLRLRLLAPFHG